jgi:NAD+ synthase
MHPFHDIILEIDIERSCFKLSLEIEKKIKYAVDWLRQQVKASGTRGIAVGISGGIDSAVVANLIARACPDSSLGVLIPIKSSSKDVEDGRAVAEKAGLRCIEIELSQLQQSLLEEVTRKLIDEGIHQAANDRITDANLRARLRMSTLYTIANNLGYLVAGTDNAAEVYTGYFTKYGDGGVDILPIASLKKYEVYQWARVLGVPRQVIERPPSAGLWEGQTDEGEMGTTYEAIDDFLAGKAISQRDKEIIERLHRATEHKRRMPPYLEFK